MFRAAWKSGLILVGFVLLCASCVEVGDPGGGDKGQIAGNPANGSGYMGFVKLSALAPAAAYTGQGKLALGGDALHDGIRHGVLGILPTLDGDPTLGALYTTQSLSAFGGKYHDVVETAAGSVTVLAGVGYVIPAEGASPRILVTLWNTDTASAANYQGEEGEAVAAIFAPSGDKLLILATKAGKFSLLTLVPSTMAATQSAWIDLPAGAVAVDLAVNSSGASFVVTNRLDEGQVEVHAFQADGSPNNGFGASGRLVISDPAWIFRAESVDIAVPSTIDPNPEEFPVVTGSAREPAETLSEGRLWSLTNAGTLGATSSFTEFTGIRSAQYAVQGGQRVGRAVGITPGKEYAVLGLSFPFAGGPALQTTGPNYPDGYFVEVPLPGPAATLGIPALDRQTLDLFLTGTYLDGANKPVGVARGLDADGNPL